VTITDALRTEHAAFRRLSGVIGGMLPTTRTPSDVHLLATIVARLLREHGQVEDHLLYATFDHLQFDQGGLQRLADEHKELDGALEDVMAAGDLADARDRLEGVLARVSDHFDLEETRFFPAIDDGVSVELLTELQKQRSAAVIDA
jgi:hemerythrin-like domain-containing protein